MAGPATISLPCDIDPDSSAPNVSAPNGSARFWPINMHPTLSPSRRDLIRLGSLSAFGLGLSDLLRARSAQAEVAKATAQSCILIWLDGGPSHLETFDPKPDAPDEVRGPFEAIPTSIPGVHLSECLELTSTIMDKLAILRSVTSPLGEHHFGTHYLMTGYKPSPALEYPTYGATVAHLRGQSGDLPPHIAVPGLNERNIVGNGFLPPATAPFAIGGNPDKPDFRVQDLGFYSGLNLKRLDRRRQMVDAFDAFSHSTDASSGLVTDPNLERAFNLIASPQAKRAFDLSEESDKTRRRYGRGGGNGIGQSCLLARRLVERGVPFVTVNSKGWDTHQNILQLKERYPGDSNAHLPSLDRALSGLIKDLSERGMLDETLVIVMGEFGRTPKINSAGGRDHWPNVFSVLMAGGGVNGGQIIGSSDALGEFPREAPTTPADLAATVYSLLGIDPGGEIRTGDGRPVRIAPDGAKVISELLG